jgi:MFS family permease
MMSRAMTATVRRGVRTGWGQVITISLTEVTSWGILYYSFPVFLAPMMHDLRWSQATLTGAYSLALLVAGLLAIPVGRWLDHARSPRLVMTLGSLVGVLALAAWAAVSNVALYYLVWLGLGFAIATTFNEPAFATITAWFPRRERALTVLTTIGGFANIIYLPLAGVLAEHLGWRLALLCFSLILGGGALLPHAVVLRPFPALPPTAHPPASGTSAPWRRWAFWQLVVAFVLAQLAISAVLVHIVPLLIAQSRSPLWAATAAGMIGTVSLAGRLLVMWRTTPQMRAALTALIFLLQAVGIAILLVSHGTAAIVIFIVLFGIGFGIIAPARASLIADRFGTASFGRTNGQMALAVTLARAVAPAGASLLLLCWGGYAPVFWLLGALCLLAAVVLLLPHRAPHE